jgi:polysaccharide biosynthesis protein PslH
MKLIFATQWAPHPPVAGFRIRHYEVLKALSQLGSVTLVITGEETGKLPELEAIRHLCENVVVLDLGEAGVRHKERYAARLRSNLGRLSLLATGCRPVRVRQVYRNGESQLAFQRLLAAHDAAWVARYSTAEILAARGPKIILDMDDIEHKTLWRELRAKPWGWGRWFTYTEVLKLACYERRLPARFARVLICSDVDRRYLRRDNVQVLPNGMNLPRTFNSAGDGRTILFFGVLSYAPNSDAAAYFASRVFPLVREHVPDARFVIGGADPSPEIRRLHGSGGVEVAGFISDLDAALANAAVVVAPLRAGSGTRIKILEAMAHGKAVVATSIGAEGIPARDSVDIFIRDKPRDMAMACVQLLRQPALRQATGVRARELVKEDFAWASIAKSVAGIVESVVERTAVDNFIGESGHETG